MYSHAIRTTTVMDNKKPLKVSEQNDTSKIALGNRWMWRLADQLISKWLKVTQKR